MPANSNSILFGLSPALYRARNPRRLGFEVNPQGYDDGRVPACAINDAGQVVAVHMGTSSSSLNFRRAELERLDLRWKDRPHSSFGTGVNPAIAFSNSNVAIVLSEQSSRLQWAAAQVNLASTDNPAFQFSTTFAAGETQQGNPSLPSVAVNRAGVVIEVHQRSGNLLYWRRGLLTGTQLTWGPEQALAPAPTPALGQRPFVAVNNQGRAVIVFRRSGALYYSVGSFDPSQTNAVLPIGFSTPVSLGIDGLRATVALTDGGSVFFTYQRPTGARRLAQLVGVLEGNTIRTLDFLQRGSAEYDYDEGTDAQIACNGTTAVQVFHAGGPTGNQLRANASLVFDRANWLSDNRSYYSQRTLRRIALPASHDAGAYAANNGQTQGLTIAQQLLYGVRYFDLRPKYSGSLGDATIDPAKITTYHDITADGVDYLGPQLTQVVAEVRAFLSQHKELVILKISHFNNFNATIFAKLAEILTGTAQNPGQGLGDWLFRPQADGIRLAERPLAAYLQETRGTVLLVVDADGATDYVTETFRGQGLLRYRDWYAADPDQGDLTVFDIFSSTTDFDVMSLSTDGTKYRDANGNVVPEGQLPQFEFFDGNCQRRVNGGLVPCDLFLLSWTLTPNVPGAAPHNNGTAFARSEAANRNLTSYLAIPAFQGPSRTHSLRMNLLYTDAVESSRSVDVAMIRNGLLRQGVV